MVVRGTTSDERTNTSTFHWIPSFNGDAKLRFTDAVTSLFILNQSFRTPFLFALTIAGFFTPIAGQSVARSKNLFIALTATDGIIDPVMKLFVARTRINTLTCAGISIVEGRRVLSASITIFLILSHCEDDSSRSFLIESGN